MEEAQAKTNDIRDTIKAEILVREVEGLTAGTYIIHWASVLSNHFDITGFKKVYGCTITEYIQQRRMSQAEYLLAHTDLQIGQIAQTIGYSTSSRFAELFRRSTGLLPLEYRKMAKRK